MTRFAARPILFVLSLLLASGLAIAQDRVTKKPSLAELQATYESHIGKQNWAAAQIVGKRILEYYASSDVGRKIEADMPVLSAKVQRQAEEQRKKDEIAKKENDAKSAAARKKATASLKSRRDEVEKITFYFAPNSSQGVANQWALYVGVPDGGKPYLRFKWMYAGENWLFVKGVTLSVDGQKIGSVPFAFYQVKRDNSGGQVWEWQDEGVDDKNIPFFRMLAKSKRTIIRYEGDRYYKDRQLSEAEKKALNTILDGYEAMKGR